MCRYLEVSRSSYYEWLNKYRLPKKKTKKEEYKQQIKEIFIESKATYGSPRITASLKRQGKIISRAYVAKLMKEEGLKCYKKRKFVKTTNSDHSCKIHDNTLNREFTVNELGKVWVSDITYIKFANSWAYLTTMIDLADRKIVGWSLSEDMTYENTVKKAWIKARQSRELINGFIHHSDRGVQYACNDFSNIFSKSNRINQSMSRKGNCWDNAVAESFFKTIKTELIYRNNYKSFIEVYSSVYDYIENWYNIKRLHSSLGYMTPLEKEMELKGYLKKAS